MNYMSTVVNILLIVFLALGTYAGWRKGLIKSLVNLVGLVAVVILSYTFRPYLSNFLIDKMPFFNFMGLEGLTAINILVYNVIAFVVIFVLLYCVLNIVISITGFIDTLLKFTVIWIIPSKIGGAIIGFFETWVFLFLLCFVLASFNLSSRFILDSKVANFMMDHTPIVGNYLYGISNAARDIYTDILKYQEENKSADELNVHILGIETNYGLISSEKVKELFETGKIDTDYKNVEIVRPTVK